MEFCKTQVLLTKEIKYLSFKTKKSLIFKVQNQFFLTIRSDFGAPYRGPRIILFFSGNMFHVKRPQLSETTKIITITSVHEGEPTTGGGCRTPRFFL